MGDVTPIPDDYPQVTAYLCIDGAAAAIDFYRRVLGATERMRMSQPDGRIGHAELTVGSGLIMLSDEFEDQFPEMGVRSPRSLGGTPVMLNVYVDDVDATFARAVEAGATALREPEDQFYGDRSGQFEDPFGHRWSVASRTEEVDEAEMERRIAAEQAREAGR